MILKKKWTAEAHLLLKCYLKGKISRKLANGENIDYSEKRKWPKGIFCLALGLNTIIFKYVYWYMKQISGELGPLVCLLLLFDLLSFGLRLY